MTKRFAATSAILLSASAAILTLAVFFHHESASRPELMLLSISRQVVKPFNASSYHWLDNENLLIGRDYRNSVSDRTYLRRRNIASGEEVEEHSLRDSIEHGESYSHKVSPNGKWVLSKDINEHLPGDKYVRHYNVCKIDATSKHRINVAHGFMETRWLADGRHWIELYGKHVLAAGTPPSKSAFNQAPIQIQRIVVRDTESPVLARTIIVPPSSVLATPGIARHLAVVTEDRFIHWNQNLKLPIQNVTISEFDAVSNVARQTYNVLLTGKGEAIQLLFTPDGDRILWKMKGHQGPPTAPPPTNSNATIIARTSIWVSGPHGQDLREIGGINTVIPARAIAPGGPMDMETGELTREQGIPRRLRWLPDGKRFSFIFDDAIWVAPAY